MIETFRELTDKVKNFRIKLQIKKIIEKTKRNTNSLRQIASNRK